MNILDRRAIEGYLIEYLKTVIGIKIPNRGKVVVFECPFCHTKPDSANIVSNINLFNCYKCNTKGKIYDIIRKLEQDKEKYTDEEIFEYVRNKFNIVLPTLSEVDVILDLYEKNNFDLTMVAKNQKAPFELDWPNKTHTDKKEWKTWLENNINFGVKTGKISNLTVIDLDKTDKIHDDIQKIMGKPLIQKTNSGYHLFYQYEPELTSTRIDELKIDILNDGKQCTIFPSIVEGIERKYISDFNIIKMPTELKEYFKKYKNISSVKNNSEKIQEIITNNDLQLDLIGEGKRNSFLMHLGGILRKELNLQDTAFVLELCNKKFCVPNLPPKEFINIIKTLDKYVSFDEKELAQKILNYLRLVEVAGSRDIKETLREDKERIEVALAYLFKEGLILKYKRLYHIIKKVDWRETFPSLSNEIPFKVPYFHDVGIFNWGDLLILGGKSKIGKTTMSVNFIKSFVEQGFKPHYICLETGSRWAKTASHLGLREGQLLYSFVADPTKIELEPNSITIIDWLLISDKSQTDSIFKHFIEQLYKTNSFLIVFMQLKQDGSWFAENMIHQFPSLSARYLYEDEEDGTFGKWIVDVVREPKGHYKNRVIPCKYDFDSRLLMRIDEIEGELNI